MSSQSPQDVLLDIFLLDGHEQKTFVFVYLPLFLANAKANQDVDLLGGLKFLVEIYDRCSRPLLLLSCDGHDKSCCFLFIAFHSHLQINSVSACFSQVEFFFNCGPFDLFTIFPTFPDSFPDVFAQQFHDSRAPKTGAGCCNTAACRWPDPPSWWICRPWHW